MMQSHPQAQSRTVPPFATAHMFCASQVWSEVFLFLKEFAYQYNGIFAQFMTMWEKQILARAIRIQKETRGYRAFIEIIELKFGKKIPWIFCTLPPFSLLRDFSFQNSSERFAIRFCQSYLIWEVSDVIAIELSSKE